MLAFPASDRDMTLLDRLQAVGILGPNPASAPARVEMFEQPRISNIFQGSDQRPEDGFWLEGIPPRRIFHRAVYDPDRQRLIVVFGLNGIPTFDVWTYSLVHRRWSRITPVGPPPLFRALHAVAYDSKRKRILVFGGGDPLFFWAGRMWNDVWELSLAGRAAWRRLEPEGRAPGARLGSSAIYDAEGDRLIVFGGEVPGQFLGDLWELGLSGSPVWRELTVPEPKPSPRARHVAVYDPARGEMLVVSGAGQSGASADVWALGLRGPPACRRLEAQGDPPPMLYLHTAVVDPIRRQLLVYGGLTFVDQLVPNRVWALDLDGEPRWTKTSTLSSSPSLFGHAAIYDPIGDQMIIYGGMRVGLIRGDLFALRLGSSPVWSQLPPLFEGPGPRQGHAAVLDRANDRLVVWSGLLAYSHVYELGLFARSLSDVDDWHALVAANESPSLVYGPGSIYDEPRHRAIIFGGYDGRSFLGTMALSLDGVPVWQNLQPLGATPPGRQFPIVVHDTRRDRLIVVGGSFPFDEQPWVLELVPEPRWQRLTATGEGPGWFAGGAGVYDPVGDRVLIFGGILEGSYGSINDVWELRLDPEPVWARLRPDGEPPHWDHIPGAAYDPVRHRMILQAWADPITDGGLTWALTLHEPMTWKKLEPVGLQPPHRNRTPLLYDPRRDRFVLFGGEKTYEYDDTWFLAFREPAIRVQLQVRPRVAQNRLNTDARGVLDLALLGGEHFDPRQADLASLDVPGWSGVSFGPSGWYRDVNQDGSEDLVIRVPIPAVTSDSIEVIGYTVDGERFEGRLAVPTVPNAQATARRSTLEDARMPSELIISAPSVLSESSQLGLGLPERMPARLTLCDVSGRRVASWSLDGTSSMASITLGGATRLVSGIYYAVLTQGARRVSRRFIFLR